MSKYSKTGCEEFLLEHSREDTNDQVANWRLLLKEEEIDKINDHVAAKINEQFAGQNIVITCILKGAVYFLVDLTRRLTIPHSLYFIEASSYHDSQTQEEQVEVLSKIVAGKFNGKTVILIDELFDNGKTLHRVKRKLLETENITLKEKDIFTCTLFKKDKVVDFPQPDLCGFTLPDLWVVGYGLDDQQTKRGWKHLFGIPKSNPSLKNDDDKIFECDEAFATLRKSLTEKINNL